MTRRNDTKPGKSNRSVDYLARKANSAVLARYIELERCGNASLADQPGAFSGTFRQYLKFHYMRIWCRLGKPEICLL